MAEPTDKPEPTEAQMSATRESVLRAADLSEAILDTMNEAHTPGPIQAMALALSLFDLSGGDLAKCIRSVTLVANLAKQIDEHDPATCPSCSGKGGAHGPH